MRAMTPPRPQVEPYGYAWQAGLRQGSRLVEICKVAVATLTHEQMIDLLRTSVAVRVVIIPPYDDATPRRCVCVKGTMGGVCIYIYIYIFIYLFIYLFIY